jgi:hypothetical protein
LESDSNDETLNRKIFASSVHGFGWRCQAEKEKTVLTHFRSLSGGGVECERPFVKLYADIDARADLSSTLKRVLTRVLHYARSTGKCWAAQKRLARDLGLAQCTVSRSLAALVKRGFLWRAPGVGRQSAIHFIVEPASDKPGDLPSAPPASRGPAPGEAVADDPRPATLRPEARLHAPPELTPAEPAALRNAPKDKTSVGFVMHPRIQREYMDPSTTGSVVIKDADERKLSDAVPAPDPVRDGAREILAIRRRLAELGRAETVANPGGYLRALMKRGPDALARDLESNRALLARVEAERARAAAEAAVGAPPTEKAAYELAWEALPEAERAAWMERGRESAEREGLLATAMAEYGAESPFVHAVVEYHAQQLHRHAPETAQERAAAPAGGRTPPGREKPAYERAWEAPRRFAGEDETSPDAAGAEDRTANPARPPT